MPDGKLVATHYGRNSVFEVWEEFATVRQKKVYSVYKDGKRWKSFDRLDQAVSAARSY